MITEQQVVDQLNAWYSEGSKCRDEGTRCPYPGNTLQHYMHSMGWLKRDLQLALCKTDPIYRESQIRHKMVTLDLLK